MKNLKLEFYVRKSLCTMLDNKTYKYNESSVETLCFKTFKDAMAHIKSRGNIVELNKIKSGKFYEYTLSVELVDNETLLLLGTTTYDFFQQKESETGNAEKALSFLQKKGKLNFVRQYYNDTMNIGEANMSVEKIRGEWFVVDMDNMTIETLEDAYECMIDEIEDGNDEFIEWLENYYIENQNIIEHKEE